ncbi:MAG: efflux RND transporter periplasmic adaptor subunit [Crocinitomicaceae bacterium]
MKNIIYRNNHQSLLGLILMLSILISGCKSENASESHHNHDAHEPLAGHTGHNDHDEESTTSAEKVVELTANQYKFTEIKLGDFELKNMSEVLNVNGHTKLPPRNQADVSVHVGGLIKSIRVLEGQFVKKGQTVATLESPEFAKLHQAYLSSKSQLNYLKLEFARQKQLQADEVNAKKTFEKVQSDLEVEEAQFDALKQQMRLLLINPDKPISTTVPIIAPISGHLTEVFVKIGSAVSPNTPLFSIVDNSEMHIDLLVYEKDLYKVKKGQKLRFVLTNQSHTEINGTIFNIGKSFENETKSVAVHAHIDDHDVDLIPGMYINALIDVGSQQVQTLPSSAIINDLGRDYIFVLESHEAPKKSHGHDHGKSNHGHHHTEEKTPKTAPDHYDFRRVEVKKGAEQLGSIEVQLMGALKSNDKIVLDGSFYLQSHLQKNQGNGGGHHH